MQKDKWIDEVMLSMNDARKASSAITFDSIEKKLTESYEVADKRKWVAAAVLILALNISAILLIQQNRFKQQQTSEYQHLAKEMGLNNSYNY